jgi:hypothetical protein
MFIRSQLTHNHVDADSVDGTLQQDPQEIFLRFIAPQFPNVFESKNNGPCAFMLEHIVLCKGCKYKCVKVQDSSMLELYVTEDISLEAALARFHETQSILYYTCEMCKGQKLDSVSSISSESVTSSVCTGTAQIRNPPQVMMVKVQLAHPEVSEADTPKKPTRKGKEKFEVVPGHGLSVEATHMVYLDERYVLTAVIYRIAKTINKGHFICDVLQWTTGKWWNCNDHKVQLLPDMPGCLTHRKGTKSSVYLLSYVREDAFRAFHAAQPARGLGASLLEEEVLRRREQIKQFFAAFTEQGNKYDFEFAIVPNEWLERWLCAHPTTLAASVRRGAASVPVGHLLCKHRVGVRTENSSFFRKIPAPACEVLFAGSESWQRLGLFLCKTNCCYFCKAGL